MTSHVFLDTNVLLDYFLARDPHGRSAAQIIHWAASHKLRASTSAVSFCNIAYILGRLEKTRIIEKDLSELLGFVSVIPNTAAMLGTALDMALPDYEDSVQYASALQGKCAYLVTANKRHFHKCSIPVLDPTEFVRNFAL